MPLFHMFLLCFFFHPAPHNVCFIHSSCVSLTFHNVIETLVHTQTLFFPFSFEQKHMTFNPVHRTTYKRTCSTHTFKSTSNISQMTVCKKKIRYNEKINELQCSTLYEHKFLILNFHFGTLKDAFFMVHSNNRVADSSSHFPLTFCCCELG